MVRKTSSAQLKAQRTPIQASETGVRPRFASDEDLRARVWAALVDAKVAREKAIEIVKAAENGKKFRPSELEAARVTAEKTIRAAAAETLDVSDRTLNRYLKDLNLYPDMDKAGMVLNPGPPRGDAAGTSNRELAVKRHIVKNHGEIDYEQLAREMYANVRLPKEKLIQRCYVALSELRAKGIIALDGKRWFVV